MLHIITNKNSIMSPKNPYSKIQQSISYLLIFSIFFLNTFHIQFFEQTRAEETSNIELISIIVADNVYSSISLHLRRYAEDIQAKLNNTKALIYVVPVSNPDKNKNISPQKIAALNEKLFYEWIGNNTSRLIWTILVWDLPIPVVHDNEKTFLSIYPYTDFNEKNFEYSYESWFYEKTKNSPEDVNPEIWHSVIAPNTWDKSKDIIKLTDFFNKDHSFYAKTWVFQNSLAEPYVFYYDWKRDVDTSSFNLWKGYELWMENIEDIAYFRYTGYLAKKISESFFTNTDNDIKNWLDAAWINDPAIQSYINGNIWTSGPDTRKTPLVWNKKVIESTTKLFFQIFNEKYLGDILKHVFNTWRYWDAKTTRVDSVISTISKRDNFMKRTLKDTNTSMEWLVDTLLKKWIARNIWVPTKVDEWKHEIRENEYWNTCNAPDRYDAAWNLISAAHSFNCNPYWVCDWENLVVYDQFWSNWVGTLENFYYWIIGKNITEADQCSMYRWTRRTVDNKSVLVEATKALNLSKAKTDAETNILSTTPSASVCLTWTPKTFPFWWGYSFFNLETWTLDLKATDYRQATKQIYDVFGAKQIWYNESTDVQDVKTDVAWKPIVAVSPKDCNEFNWLYTNPDNLPKAQWRCDNSYSTHISKYSYEPYTWNTFDSLMRNIKTWKIYFGGADYHNRYIFLDWANVKTDIENPDKCLRHQQFISYDNYYFKRVYSAVEHKSPTDEEYWALLKNMAPTSVPVDRDRYVEFVSAKWNQKKFDYPNLFRVFITDPKDLTYDKTKAAIKQYLDQKSAQFNAIVSSENPAWLWWVDATIYNLLKVWSSYPNGVNFFSYLSSDSKVLDEVVKNVLWFNTNSIESKYQYVFGHYLDIDGNTPSPDAWHRSDYEISYLGWFWDPENMYIRSEADKDKENVDPTVAGILAKVNNLKNAIQATKITSQGAPSQKADFMCWPPDWVPIFEWFDAIQCRLTSLVPPVSVQAGKCTAAALWQTWWDSAFSDFGWDFPAITNPVYFEDRNKNWIIDWAELIGDGEIFLISDTDMYSFNKPIKLKANLLYETWWTTKLIWVDNYSRVKFELISLNKYTKWVKELVYNINPAYNKNDFGETRPFISFTPSTVVANKGISGLTFTSKNTDVDAIIRASIITKDKNNVITIDKQSNDLLVKIRWVSMDISPKINSVYSSSLEAWSANSIDFELKSLNSDKIMIPTSFPLSLKVYNTESWDLLKEEENLSTLNYNFNSAILKKAWSYKFVFTDSYWITVSQIITVVPAKAEEIKLIASSNQIVKWTQVEILTQLKDAYGNITSWELYNVIWNVSGAWYFVNWDGNDIDSKKIVTRNILEGYSSYVVKSTGTVWKMQIKYSLEDWTLESSILEVEVLDSAKIVLDVVDKDNIVVWKEKHKINLEVRDGSSPWNLLNKFNWVVYFDYSEINWVIIPNIVKVENWKPVEDIYFYPNFVAVRKSTINAISPWITKVEWNIITVLPDIPMYLWLIISKAKVEAKAWIKSSLKASIYDRYNNITFNDSSHSVDFSIPDKFKKFVDFWWAKYTDTKVALEWVTSIDIFATDMPWEAYIIGRVNPWLETNSFVKKDEQSEVTINWISANAVNFNTYYLFNEDKLNHIDYNSLYTILQWSNYWDVTHPKYLGWEILFNKTWRSLAVSSIINNPYSRETVFWFTPWWKFIFNETASDDQSFLLENELVSTQPWTFINIFDSVYKDNIARIRLNFESNVNLVDCKTSEDESISKCNIPTDSSFILLKWIWDVTTEKTATDMSLLINDFKVLTIDSNWKVYKVPWIAVELDPNAEWNMLWIFVKMNKEVVGYLWVKFNTENISIFDSNSFPWVLSTNKNQIVIEQLSSDFVFENNFLWVSSKWPRWISFYKFNNSSTDSTDTDLQSIWDKIGLEKYSEEAWIWWTWKNKMLLEFAWWNTIWESTKFNQTYSFINLWDPVVYLDTKKSWSSDYDKSIWKRIIEEKSKVIENYSKIDFNWDGVSDIVVFYDNGFVELLANYDWNYKNMWNLVYIADAWKLRKWVWDFFWDWFDDIVFANKDWALWVYNNIQWKFTRKEPVILNESSWEWSIKWAIQQLEVFDMDKDWKMDIVIVDDSGELSILYWTQSNDISYPWRPIFTKKFIDNSLWMKLSTDVTKNWGAIYFDSLPQLTDSRDQSKYEFEASKVQAEWEAWGSPSDSTWENLKPVLDKLIFYQEKYKVVDSYTWVTESERKDAMLGVIWTDATWVKNTQAVDNILAFNKELKILNWTWLTDTTSVNTEALEKVRTFVRSNYAEAYWIDIQKSYRDVNGNPLQSWDLIEVILKLKNNTNSTINDVIYDDSNKNFFKLDANSTYTIETNAWIFTKPINSKVDWEFNIAFKDFNIKPNETVTIKYKLSTPTVSFGKIKVWIFDNTDNYWDISLAPSNVCWEDNIAWLSTATRSYNKWTITFNDNSSLPPELEKNKVDADGNGIPDYIDELIADAKSAWALSENYANDQLDTFNKDANGNYIPDNSDLPWSYVFEFEDESNVNAWWLSDSNIAAIDSGIDSIVQWLGCWFWWWACMSMPLNRAPLAPGWSLTLMWMPISTWIWYVWAPSTWFPIFSVPTDCKIPVWPPCPKKAWWLFDSSKWDWVSQFRLFITPTLTWAMWIAMCMWPNSASYIKSPWVDPLFPGWTCVAIATPLAWCNDDWSDWDISSQWLNGNNNSSSWNWFFNASSCTKKSDISANKVMSAETHNNIIKYINWNLNDAWLILKDPAVQHGGISTYSWPEIWMDDSSWMDISIDVDALSSLDVGNVVKVDLKRVSSFPDFIMDWITRQIEEIVNKLTTLPTLYIILPDFSALADSGWTNFGSDMDKELKKIKEKNSQTRADNEKAEAAAKAKEQSIANDSLRSWQSSINSWKSSIRNMTASAKEWMNWVRAAYQLISNLPLITIKNETVDINIPWIWPEEIDKWIENAKWKINTYSWTIAKTKNEWSTFAKTPENAVSFEALIDAERLISSIEKNVQVLEEYKQFPTKFRKYLMWKEHFLSQILCNLEVINKVVGWRIWDNWIRLQKWVELIILIKAILKAWQGIIDIFADFNANCSVCHNERNNLMYWIVKLISAMVPKLPIIEFPKWPDIILDLHNIRAWLNILMPEFNFVVKPISLPQLPNLYLPSTPNVDINIWVKLPSIPVLPSLPELPDLPDLPSLPEIKLPDLPPPPKVPKLFAAVEAIIKILKLISKVICLWRQIGNLMPPEWRVWDAIAWMTERNGVLPMDKIVVDFPAFGIWFIDAIKVTTYVNLEFDVDFIVEMSKSTLEPFNSFTNDMTNFWNQFKIPDIDLRWTVPNVEIDATITPTSYNSTKKDDKILTLLWTLTGITYKWILEIIDWFKENREEFEIKEFKKMLKNNISSLAISANPKEKDIYNILSSAIDFDASIEKKFITNLLDNNNEKFNLVNSYIKEEQNKNKALDNEMSKIERGEKSIKDFTPIKNITYWWLKVSAIEDHKNYDKLLKDNYKKNQNNILEAIKKLGEDYEDKDIKEIKKSWDKIINSVKTWIEAFKVELTEGITPLSRKDSIQPKNAIQNFDALNSNKNIINNSLLPINTSIEKVEPNLATNNSSWLDYNYDYEWIYIITKTWKQARLFEYLDEVDKDSNVIELDKDNDWDMDLIYKMWDAIYMKENLDVKANLKHISWVDGARDIWDIDDYLWLDNSDSKLPFALNYFKEIISESNRINFRFSSPNWKKQNSFRLEYYDYIDRFDKTNNKVIKNEPINPSTHINYVDMITNSEDHLIIETKDRIIIKDNFAYLDSWVGDSSIKYYEYNVLNENETITIQEWKRIYSWNSPLTIKYKFPNSDNYIIQNLGRNMNMEFQENADITVLNWSMIIITKFTKEYSWNISEFNWMPIIPWTEIELWNKNVTANIGYFWWGNLRLDNLSSYKMVDLLWNAESYTVGFNTPNDFFYAKAYEFNKTKKSTITDLSLMSPQAESDDEAPSIESEWIRVPVYQEQTINLQKDITDISWIKEVYIDFDLNLDTSGDWILDNDKDSLITTPEFKIKKWNTVFDLIVWKFDIILNKKVKLYATDTNNNTSSAIIDFEVYAPVPNIMDVSKSDSKINWIIDEEINLEPIDIFRFRDWVLQLMDTKNTTQFFTDSIWKFWVVWSNNSSWVVIKSSSDPDSKLFTINETTWKISLIDPKYWVQVKPWNSNSKTKLDVVDKNTWEVIFSQNFNLPENQKIQWVTSFDNLAKWIYYKGIDSNYKLIDSPSNSPSIPSWAFITDSWSNAIVWIWQDWTIYILDNNYKLGYENSGDSIQINILNSGNSIIWSLLFNIEAEYIIK